MELHDVVKKLVGSIKPVGETHTDNERFENLKIMTDLVNKLVTDIDEVAQGEDHHAYSIKRAGEYASHFMTVTLGIEE